MTYVKQMFQVMCFIKDVTIFLTSRIKYTPLPCKEKKKSRVQ